MYQNRYRIVRKPRKVLLSRIKQNLDTALALNNDAEENTGTFLVKFKN